MEAEVESGVVGVGGVGQDDGAGIWPDVEEEDYEVQLQVKMGTKSAPPPAPPSPCLFHLSRTMPPPLTSHPHPPLLFPHASHGPPSEILLSLAAPSSSPPVTSHTHSGHRVNKSSPPFASISTCLGTRVRSPCIIIRVTRRRAR